LAVGAVANQVAGEVEQEVLPELAAHLLVGGFGDGVAVLAQGIDATLEALSLPTSFTDLSQVF
jgi:hypothetical protein